MSRRVRIEDCRSGVWAGYEADFRAMGCSVQPGLQTTSVNVCCPPGTAMPTERERAIWQTASGGSSAWVRVRDIETGDLLAAASDGALRGPAETVPLGSWPLPYLSRPR